MERKFDILPFLNSSAIAEHCRAIKYRFSAPDMAYLIWASEKRSIEEKHAAWRALIEAQPDAQVAERPWTPYIKSLHAFLRRYMELQDKYIALFYRDEPDCVYSYSVWYPGDRDCSDDCRIFPAFRVCLAAIQADVPEVSSAEVTIRVTKRWLNRRDDEAAKYMVLSVDPQGKAWALLEDRGIISAEESEILDAFNGMWPEIPTPFQRGDILTCHRRGRHPERPFVLNAILYWEGAVPERTLDFLRRRGDHTDLEASVYRLREDGSLFLDHGPCYLDMEYYDGELDGSARFLPVLSGFLKGEYDVAVLLEAYDYLKAERGRKERREYLSSYQNPYLAAAGFQEENKSARSAKERERKPSHDISNFAPDKSGEAVL